MNKKLNFISLLAEAAKIQEGGIWKNIHRYQFFRNRKKNWIYWSLWSCTRLFFYLKKLDITQEILKISKPKKQRRDVLKLNSKFENSPTKLEKNRDLGELNGQVVLNSYYNKIDSMNNKINNASRWNRNKK